MSKAVLKLVDENLGIRSRFEFLTAILENIMDKDIK